MIENVSTLKSFKISLNIIRQICKYKFIIMREVQTMLQTNSILSYYNWDYYNGDNCYIRIPSN